MSHPIPNTSPPPAVSPQLDPFAAIDLSLLGRPAITAEHGDVSLKVVPTPGGDSAWGWGVQTDSDVHLSVRPSTQGEFFGVGRRRQSPFSPKPVGLPEAREPMVLLALTEFVANSAAFVYFTAGALRRNISGEAVRGGSGTARRCCPAQPCLGRGSRGHPRPAPPAPGPSAAFQLPRRFPIQLRTKSLGGFSPQVGGEGGGKWDRVGCGRARIWGREGGMGSGKMWVGGDGGRGGIGGDAGTGHGRVIGMEVGRTERCAPRAGW